MHGDEDLTDGLDPSELRFRLDSVPAVVSRLPQRAAPP